jgi:adenylosuccinate lyase
MEGNKNDLIQRIASDESFGLSKEELKELLNVKTFVGRAPEQVIEFNTEWVKPLLVRSEHSDKFKKSILNV